MTGSYRIEATHFVARIDVNDVGTVMFSAPILSYMRGWPLRRVIDYCASKFWTVTPLETAP